MTNRDEIYCPECGNTTRCYECATRGGWISKAEQDEIDRDDDRAQENICKMKDSRAMYFSGLKRNG